MLTAKENMLQTVRGGAPDRLVNQYEALSLIPTPYMMRLNPGLVPGGEPRVNLWGVTMSYPAGTPGVFPVHTPDKILVKDMDCWQDHVKAPSLEFSQAEWDLCRGIADSVDGTKAFRAAMVVPGLFEQTHNFCSMMEALPYYITHPTQMHDMIRYLADWELALAEKIVENLHPDAIFHHDDWGTERSSFLSPAMFADFFLEPYQQIYRYYHEHGVELVVHHSDSYAANLVPTMIEMGIDVWQGCMRSNNVPELIAKYGGQITFMGDIDNKDVDFTGWTQQDCRAAARRAIESCGSRYYIPCITQGGPGSVYPGAYSALTEEIDRYNTEVYGFTQQQLEAQRHPTRLMGR